LGCGNDEFRLESAPLFPGGSFGDFRRETLNGNRGILFQRGVNRFLDTEPEGISPRNSREKSLRREYSRDGENIQRRKNNKHMSEAADGFYTFHDACITGHDSTGFLLNVNFCSKIE
jgi:hypothetical protein